MVVDKEWAFIAHTVTALQDTWLHLFVASHSKCFLGGYFLPVAAVFHVFLGMLPVSAVSPCFPGGYFLPVSAMSSCFPVSAVSSMLFWGMLSSCYCCVFCIFLGEFSFLLLLCLPCFLSSYPPVWHFLCCVWLHFVGFPLFACLFSTECPLHLLQVLNKKLRLSSESQFQHYIANAPSALFYLDFVTTAVTGLFLSVPSYACQFFGTILYI